ncbi:MAG TPA: GatB/YqeY domain-containing protein [Ignavibacteriales bacterium]|jgi:hypothetical protein|nr:GatB/YqeY domain-containing protein [Ignavibacteriales bacterium]
MNLKDKINEEIKSCMKSGDKLRLETIRSIRALILEFEKSGANKELTPDEEIKLLNAAAKKRKDAIEVYEKAGKIEQMEKEKKELEIIQEFLPKQLTEDEIKEIVKKVVEEVNAQGKKDFGKVMPVVMKQVSGRADGKMVKSIVEEILG